MSYHQFLNDEGPYGSFETFYHADADCEGWFWWPCFPGCQPESDPVGPFPTEAEAIQAAQEP